MDTKIIYDKEGREVELRTEFPEERIDAFYDGKKIGEFDFREIEFDHCSELLVLRMYLDCIPGFTRKGIGTEIIMWAEELSGYSVIFGRDEGEEGDCSSHLTGDGLAFSNHIKNRN